MPRDGAGCTGPGANFRADPCSAVETRNDRIAAPILLSIDIDS
jgi:hypothetical protein